MTTAKKIQIIEQECATEFMLTIRQLRAKTRQAKVIEGRFAFIQLAYEAGFLDREVGVFLGQEKSTITKARNSFMDRLSVEPKLAGRMEALRGRVRAKLNGHESRQS